jgi:ankyrin repeat protein
MVHHSTLLSSATNCPPYLRCFFVAPMLKLFRLATFSSTLAIRQTIPCAWLYDGEGEKRDSLNERDRQYVEEKQERLPGLLEIAAWEGHVDIVQVLLAWSDAWTDEEKDGALANGARKWEPEIVAALLATGKFSQETLLRALDAAVQNGPSGDPTVPRAGFSTNDWMTAKSAQEARVIELLLDAGLVINLGKLLCQVSFRPCEIEAMRFLLERGADVMTRERNGWTPLHFASQMRLEDLHLDSPNAEGIKLLVEYGADVYAEDDEEMTPMHWLAGERNVSMLKHCLKNGAKPKHGQMPRNKHGESLLHMVSAKFGPQRCEMVEAVLDAGFDVNSCTLTGWTPLMCSIFLAPELHQVTSLLLSRGADVTAATDEGLTALHRIADFHDRKTSLAEELIARGADVSALATVAGTRMERSSLWGHSFGERLNILAAKSPTNVVERRTPLHLAAESRALQTVCLLLKHGADALAADSRGAIPAVLAAWSIQGLTRSSNRTSVLKELLRAAPVGYDMPNEKGLSVRDWVRQEGYSENWRLWW